MCIPQRVTDGTMGGNQDLRSFQLILEYIKALPVSCLIMIVLILQSVLSTLSLPAICICAAQEYMFCRDYILFYEGPIILRGFY